MRANFNKETEYKDAFLSNEPYNEKGKVNCFERERRRDKEVVPEMSFGFGCRTETERVWKELKTAENLDYEEKDMKMVYYPEWKIDNENKWRTKDGFKNRVGRPPQGKSVWGQSPILEKGEEREKYEGGLEEIGEKVTHRGRKQEFEVKISFCFFIWLFF